MKNKMSLQANSLSKSYGPKVVVNDVSINVKQGEIVGLLGPNGAGKTTTFYSIVGLIKPDEGSVYLGGKDITSLPMFQRARNGIGYLAQEASVFRNLSVRDNILAVLEHQGISKEKQEEKVEVLMKEFGLVEISDSMGKVLSGGERRRTEIARALATDPKFILLDEPFAGVDPLAVSDIQTVIRNLKSKGIGVLITDHNVRETLGIVDQAYIMNNGELLVNGTPEEIINDEKARKFYLGSQFRL